MCSVTSIEKAKFQRKHDQQTEMALIEKESELERSLEYVREQLREVRNRLGTNKPDGPEAA